MVQCVPTFCSTLLQKQVELVRFGDSLPGALKFQVEMIRRRA